MGERAHLGGGVREGGLPLLTSITLDAISFKLFHHSETFLEIFPIVGRAPSPVEGSTAEAACHGIVALNRRNGTARRHQELEARLETDSAGISGHADYGGQVSVQFQKLRCRRGGRRGAPRQCGTIHGPDVLRFSMDVEHLWN